MSGYEIIEGNSQIYSRKRMQNKRHKKALKQPNIRSGSVIVVKLSFIQTTSCS